METRRVRHANASGSVENGLPLPLDEVDRELLDDGDGAFCNRVFFDEIVQLGRQHRLDEMFSIGNDYTIPVDVTGGATGWRDLLEGQELDGRLGVEKFVVVVNVLVDTGTDAGGELRKSRHGGRGQETRRAYSQTCLAYVDASIT